MSSWIESDEAGDEIADKVLRDNAREARPVWSRAWRGRRYHARPIGDRGLSGTALCGFAPGSRPLRGRTDHTGWWQSGGQPPDSWRCPRCLKRLEA